VFNTCPHQHLQSMTGEPLHISFREGVKPHTAYTPIPVPYYWKEEVKQGIDRDVELGIIEPVTQGTQTTWCSRMVITPNPSQRRPPLMRGTAIPAFHYQSSRATQPRSSLSGQISISQSPMGFHSSGDAYTRRFDDITANFPRKTRCVDDSLL